MSEDWSIPLTSPGAPRPKRADLERILAGRKLHVRQIAREFGTTTRAVQLVVCAEIHRKTGWLARVMHRGEYAYYLAAESEAA